MTQTIKTEIAIAAELQTKGNFMVLASSTVIGAGAVLAGPDSEDQKAYFAEAQAALTKLVGKQNSSNVIKAAKDAAQFLNTRGWDGLHGYDGDVAKTGLGFAEYLCDVHGIKNRTQLARFMKTGSAEKQEPSAVEVAMQKEAAAAEARAEAAGLAIDVFSMVQAGAGAPNPVSEAPVESEEVTTLEAFVQGLDDQELGELADLVVAEITKRKSVPDAAAA